MVSCEINYSYNLIGVSLIIIKISSFLYDLVNFLFVLQLICCYIISRHLIDKVII